MIYEVYLDSILLEVFLWNYCVLKLTDTGFGRIAAGRRILTGAAIGTIGYTVPLFLPIGLLGKGILEAGSCWGLLVLTFPVKGLSGFLKVLENYLKYALLLGGSVLLVLRIPGVGRRTGRVFITLLTLALLTAGGLYLQRKNNRNGRRHTGKVILIRDGVRLNLNAFVDSGNSLVEPISGKPVCVLDQDTARILWGDEDDIPFRVIPYRSVNQKKGLMKGYLLPEMQLELDGPIMTFHDVYMAVCPQKLTNDEGKTQVLIHPALTVQDRKGNQTEKEREGQRK